MNTAKRKTIRKQKNKVFQEKVIQIRRVTKVCKGGKKLAFRVVMAIGNENGLVGVGVGKADDVVNAISKGITDAQRNLTNVILTKTKTIPHIVTGDFGACSVLVKPASQGNIDKFSKTIQENGFLSLFRRSRGRDINASCGSLANKKTLGNG